MDVSVGDGTLFDVTITTGDVALLIGEGARRNLGLVAGDNAKASIWLLVGILIGGGLNFLVRKPYFFLGLNKMPFLGVVTGELAGLDCEDPGTRVSELVAALIARGLGSEPVNVSEEEVPRDRDIGTVKVTSEPTGSGSDDDSPGGSAENVI